jgi:hypothetical protein
MFNNVERNQSCTREAVASTDKDAEGEVATVLAEPDDSFLSASTGSPIPNVSSNVASSIVSIPTRFTVTWKIYLAVSGLPDSNGHSGVSLRVLI